MHQLTHLIFYRTVSHVSIKVLEETHELTILTEFRECEIVGKKSVVHMSEWMQTVKFSLLLMTPP